ncbi:MAG: STAS-like domain-containing protein [Patescibacteria group bacterium]|jgi:hypothetical protein
MDIYIKNFSTALGGRFKKEGNFSGEEFREKYLEPLFNGKKTDQINIYLDGTEGYPSSFLEEAFGGLVRLLNDKEIVKKRLRLVTSDSMLEKEILNYIENAL